MSAPRDAVGAIVRDPDLIAIISAKAGFFNPYFFELGRLLRDLDRAIASPPLAAPPYGTPAEIWMSSGREWRSFTTA